MYFIAQLAKFKPYFILSKVVFSLPRRWQVPPEVDTKFLSSEYYRICFMVLYYTECLCKMRFILRGIGKAKVNWVKTIFKHVVLAIVFAMSAEKRIFPYIAKWRVNMSKYINENDKICIIRWFYLVETQLFDDET